MKAGEKVGYHLQIPCMECLKQERPSLLVEIIEIPVTDSNCYDVSCSNGHKNRVLVQAPKFEILFDFGAYALIDGYHRESLSSFAASLERFHEFCINVLSFHSHIDEEIFKETWKLIDNQSERQLGAMYFLFLLTFKSKPYDIMKKTTPLRNKITHKGYIPTYKEVTDYATEIVRYMFDVLKKLKADCYESFQQVLAHDLHKSNSTNQPPNQLSFPVLRPATFMNIIGDESTWESFDFQKGLDNLKKQRESMRESPNELAQLAKPISEAL